MRVMATSGIPRRSTLDWTLEAISLTALAAMFLFVWMRMPELSEIVGRRFGASSAAKNAFWFICLVAAGIWLVFTVSVASLRWIQRLSPGKRGLPEVLYLQRSMMLWVKAVIMLAIGYIVWVEVGIARGSARRLNAAFTPIVAGATLLIMAVYFVRMARSRK